MKKDGKPLKLETVKIHTENKLNWWNWRKSISISKNANCKDKKKNMMSKRMIINGEWKAILCIKEVSVGKMYYIKQILTEKALLHY